MNYLKFFSVLALLFSSPIFSEESFDPYGTDGDCFCEVTCDLTTGDCYYEDDVEFDGGCECWQDCHEIADNVWECDVECECLGPDSPAATNARQAAVLVYSSFNASQTGALHTGILGTGEGTYADKEVVVIIDADTPQTNEVEIRPAFCN